mgnify:CR=1 FL=1
MNFSTKKFRVKFQKNRVKFQKIRFKFQKIKVKFQKIRVTFQKTRVKFQKIRVKFQKNRANFRKSGSNYIMTKISNHIIECFSMKLSIQNLGWTPYRKELNWHFFNKVCLRVGKNNFALEGLISTRTGQSLRR